MTARKWTLTMGLALLAMLVLATPAMAGRRWCARDPIFQLNGADVQLWAAIPEEYVPLVTGPVNVEVSVPKGVTAKVLFLDAGFNGYGETVSARILKGGNIYPDGSFDVKLRVTVPINTKAAKSIPLQLTANVGGDATEIAAGVWQYDGGSSYTVEMTNDGTVLEAVFPVAGN